MLWSERKSLDRSRRIDMRSYTGLFRLYIFLRDMDRYTLTLPKREILLAMGEFEDSSDGHDSPPFFASR